jgi:uncharacterized protein (TIGR01244 family)
MQGDEGLKKVGVIFLIWFCACSILIAQEESEEIPNWKEARPGIFTSGQPTSEGMTQIVSRGIKTVVNLRPHAEAGARDETKELSLLQIKYYNIPITPDSLTADNVAQFARIMREGNQPLLIHCASGNRVGGMWLAYRMLYDRAPKSVALQEAWNIGLKPSMEEIVLRFLRDSEPKD